MLRKVITRCCMQARFVTSRGRMCVLRASARWCFFDQSGVARHFNDPCADSLFDIPAWSSWAAPCQYKALALQSVLRAERSRTQREWVSSVVAMLLRVSCLFPLQRSGDLQAYLQLIRGKTRPSQQAAGVMPHVAQHTCHPLSSCPCQASRSQVAQTVYMSAALSRDSVKPLDSTSGVCCRHTGTLHGVTEVCVPSAPDAQG